MHNKFFLWCISEQNKANKVHDYSAKTNPTRYDYYISHPKHKLGFGVNNPKGQFFPEG